MPANILVQEIAQGVIHDSLEYVRDVAVHFGVPTQQRKTVNVVFQGFGFRVTTTNATTEFGTGVGPSPRPILKTQAQVGPVLEAELATRVEQRVAALTTLVTL